MGACAWWKMAENAVGSSSSVRDVTVFSVT